MTYSSKLGFAILVAFYPTVKQLVPKLQDAISKTDVQSQQPMGFNVIIGNNRKSE